MSNKALKHKRRANRKAKEAGRAKVRLSRQLEAKGQTMEQLHAAGLESFRIAATEWLNRAVTHDPLLAQEDGRPPRSEDIQALLAVPLEATEAGLREALRCTQAWAKDYPSRQPLVHALTAVLPSLDVATKN